MKTIKTQYMLLATALLTGSLLMSSCSNEDEPLSAAVSGQAKSLSFSIVDSGLLNAADTRATTTDYVTSFVSGDQISLVVLNSSGSAIEGYENVCLTYDGSSWTASSTIEYDETTLADATYCAVYPYSSNGYTLDASTDDHFSSIVSNWSVSGDQSGDNYTTFDLMTGSTSETTESGNDYAISLELSHRMALAVISLPAVTYTFTNTDTTLDDYSISASLESVSLSLNSGEAQEITPYSDGSSYRVLINPSTPYTLSGDFDYGGTTYTYTFTDETGLTAATYYKHTVSLSDDSSSSSISMVLEVGDYYMADGSIVKASEITSEQYEDVIGVVFYIGTTDAIAEAYSSCTHGLVYAVSRVASTTDSSSSFSSSDAYAALYGSSSKTTTVEGDTREEGDTSTLRGYEDTQVLIAVAEAGTNFSYFYNVFTNYTVDAPSMTTGWYLPSVAEFNEINENSDALDTSLGTISGETCFQTTTDGDTTYKFWTSTVRSAGVYFYYDANFDASSSSYYSTAKGVYNYYRLALAF